MDFKLNNPIYGCIIYQANQTYWEIDGRGPTLKNRSQFSSNHQWLFFLYVLVEDIKDNFTTVQQHSRF